MTATQLVASRTSAGSGTLLVRTDVDCSLTVNGSGFGTLPTHEQRTATLSEGPNAIACTADDGTRLAVIAFGARRGDVINGTPAAQYVERLDIELRSIDERRRAILPRVSGSVVSSSTLAVPPAVSHEPARPAAAIISCVNAGFRKSSFGLMAESRFHVARPIHVLRKCARCPDLIAIEIEADSPIDSA